MPQIFDTSANEIANYRGNSAAALGGDPGAATILGDTDATLVSDAMRNIGANNFQKNKAAYDKKVKDQQELWQTLNDQDAQLKTMLPNDRERLIKDFREPIRKLLLDNPNITTDFKKYTQLQGMLSDFKEAKAYAGVRLKSISDMDDAAAKELDPEKRSRIVAHRNDMYNQDLYSMVKPYQEALDFTSDILANVKPIVSTSEDFKGDKVVTTTHSVTPIDDFTRLVNEKYLDPKNGTLKNQIDEFSNSVDELPTDVKQQTVDSWNEKIKQANADNGLQPGNPKYIPEIKTEEIKDDQGNPHLLIHASPVERVRAQSILDFYKNEKVTNEKISDIPSKMRQQNAAAQKDLADAHYKSQEAKLILPATRTKLLAEAEEARGRRDEALAKAKTERDKLTDKKDVGDFYINQMLQTFDPKKYDAFPDAGKILNIPGISGKVLATREADGTLKSSLSDIEMTALGERFKINGKTSVVKPESVIYNSSNPQDPFFITSYRILGTAGKTPDRIETRIIRPNGVLENLIKGVVGEETSGKENEDYKTTMRRWRERTGKENINGSVFSEFDKPEWQGTNDQLQNKINNVWGK